MYLRQTYFKISLCKYIVFGESLADFGTRVIQKIRTKCLNSCLGWSGKEVFKYLLEFRRLDTYMIIEKTSDLVLLNYEYIEANKRSRGYLSNTTILKYVCTECRFCQV